MNSFHALLLLSFFTLAGALWPGAARAGTVFSDHDLPGHLRYIRSEVGKHPLGYHIEGEFGVFHDAHDGDQEAVFYVVDKHGNKCSVSIGTYLYHEYLTFQWFNDQQCLLVVTNAHKHFEMEVYARDAQGNFKMLDAKIDPQETREKISVVTYLKGHPEWTRYVFGPFEDGESHQVLGGSSVGVDEVSADDTTVDISVDEVIVMDDSTVRICYRFDASDRKFVRQKAILLGERRHPVLTLSNAKLEKAIKKIARMPDQ